ncbi:binding-protein-dependent transport systems inner membrane component [Cellulomonas flavigena DSM 20109]|uniref:Binding-protein-dependent transport systems inner membrane component n=1 Tax=Cellulomonas flavigena (strain ATCC 482 / DSM 20109 / BCRC 11376 / JCM 18109 / NBRC 3775 / NCIMB 8073 / NRS 134) TaxID=446466 RepID=D5UKQ0_CELFN|nr:sugar ABC transporter permease [Cellulomonas flavigena]ADG73868.1 binding-protein-dependent transport systems inner membrane component [Cellulomonas flavigena DSM 20109]
MSAATTAVPAAAEAARGTRRRAPLSDRRRQEARLGLLLASPAIVVLLAVVGYPILQAVWDSLFNYKLTNPDARSFVGLGNYGLILSDPIWWQALGVTVLITVVTVVVELVLGFALALVMNNALGALRPGLRTAILIPYAIITVVSAFAFRFMFDLTSGFVNAWLPFVGDDTDWFASFGTAVTVISISEIWKTTPFISLLLLSGLAQVPGELQEAAKVDGATWWQRMRRVTIPNMKAAIMVALLFRTLDAFRIFDNIFIMTNGAAGTESVSFLAYRQTIQRLEIGIGSAVSVLLTIAVALIALMFVKGFKVNLAASTRAGR